MKNVRRLLILPFLLLVGQAHQTKAWGGPKAPGTILEILPYNLGAFAIGLGLTGLATYVGVQTAKCFFTKENSLDGFNKKTILPRVEQVAKILIGTGLTYYKHKHLNACLFVLR